VEGVLDGVPQIRMVVLRPDEVTIEDTWTVSGLCGTGSHHFRVDDVVVPAERTCRPMADPPCVDEPIVRIPSPTLFSPMVAAVALGVAQGALDDILAVAAAKVPLLAGAPLAANPHFQYELATADTELRAARALLYEAVESVWATAVGGVPFTVEQRARVRAAAVWATVRSSAVVDAAYRAGGGSSIYTTCPLQRRLRDIHAITQHFLVRRDAMTMAGAVLAGQDADLPWL
jgi:alkylation response protein AidB-like acyl-CoA dehydrogenase